MKKCVYKNDGVSRTARCAAGIAIVTAARRVPVPGTLYYLRTPSNRKKKKTHGRAVVVATTLPQSRHRGGYTQHPSVYGTAYTRAYDAPHSATAAAE